MGSSERRNHLKEFLDKFDENPITFKPDKKPMQQFILCYLGLCFVEGYRIVQKIGDNIFLLSLLNFQHGDDGVVEQSSKIFGIYRVLSINFVEKDLNENTEARVAEFNKMKDVASLVAETEDYHGIQFHLIFANSAKYSIIDRHFLNKGLCLNIKKFFPKDYGIKNQNGYRVLDDRVEGTKLHEIVQLFLKGSGQFQNKTYVEREALHHIKLSYALDKVLNTICLIIGKQMIEGGFVCLSSEKWMRKSTVKKFKRFDLLLRNEQKVCIIDWKFSKVNADQKINTSMFAQKNRQYFQLARKEYNANVQLKFYCFHQRCDERFHRYTFADYNYETEEICLSEEHEMEDQDEAISAVELERLIQAATKNRKQAKVVVIPDNENGDNIKPLRNIGEDFHVEIKSLPVQEEGEKKPKIKEDEKRSPSIFDRFRTISPQFDDKEDKKPSNIGMHDDEEIQVIDEQKYGKFEIPEPITINLDGDMVFITTKNKNDKKDKPNPKSAFISLSEKSDIAEESEKQNDNALLLLKENNSHQSAGKANKEHDNNKKNEKNEKNENKFGKGNQKKEKEKVIEINSDSEDEAVECRNTILID